MTQLLTNIRIQLMRTLELRDGGTYPAVTPVSNHEHRLIMQANEQSHAIPKTAGAPTESYPKIAIVATPVAEELQRA